MLCHAGGKLNISCRHLLDIQKAPSERRYCFRILTGSVQQAVTVVKASKML